MVFSPKRGLRIGELHQYELFYMYYAFYDKTATLKTYFFYAFFLSRLRHIQDALNQKKGFGSQGCWKIKNLCFYKTIVRSDSTVNIRWCPK